MLRDVKMQNISSCISQHGEHITSYITGVILKTLQFSFHKEYYVHRKTIYFCVYDDRHCGHSCDNERWKRDFTRNHKMDRWKLRVALSHHQEHVQK